MSELILKIIEAYPEQKQVRHHANKLKKGFSLGSSVHLEDLCHLAYWLYIASEDTESCLAICGLLKEAEFDGNYNKWTWLAGAFQLGAYVCDKSGSALEGDGYLNKLNAPMSALREMPLKLYLNTIERRLNDEKLCYAEISNAKKAQDVNSELNWRKGQIFKMIFIKVMGGSKIYSNEDAENEIAENMLAIRSLLN